MIWFSTAVNNLILRKAEKVPDEGIFTAKELDALEKKMAEVEKWRDDKVAEQEAMSLSEMPKLTVSSIKSKVTAFILRTLACMNFLFLGSRSWWRGSVVDWEG